MMKGARRRWRLAFGIGLPCAMLSATVAWNKLPAKQYTTESMLHVAATPPRLVKATADLSADGGGEFRNYQQTHESLIKSRLVLNSALRDPKVTHLATARPRIDTFEELGAGLSVSFKGEILNITMSGENPRELAVLANAVTDAYMREVVSVERNQRLLRHATLKEIYGRYQESLKGIRRKLKDLAEAAGSNDKQTLTYKHQIAIGRHASAERELTQTRSDLRRARMDLAFSQSKTWSDTRPPVTKAALEEAIRDDPTVRQHMAAIITLRDSYARNRRLAKDPTSDPSVTSITKRLKSAQESLSAHQERLRREMTSQHHEDHRRKSQADGKLLERKVAFLEELESNLVDEVETLAKGTKAFNLTTLDLESLQDEIQNSDLAAKQVGAEIEALNVELSAPTRVRLVEKAEVPRLSSVKRKVATTGLAAFGSLAFVVLGISKWDSRTRRVDRADEVVRGLGINLIGVLPTQPRLQSRPSARSAGVVDFYRSDILLESVNAIRALLLHTSEAESLRVLMVTSALKGEGKTSLSCHLAASLARARRRTLLIDCDLRDPSAHRTIGLPLGPGVCDILRGEAAVDDLIRPTAKSGLWMITAGLNDEASIEALEQGGLGAIFERVKGQYDFIIVDTAPVLPVADTLTVSLQADAVIFSIMRDVSRLPKVHAAYERLAKLGVRMLGAVVAGGRHADHDSVYPYNARPASRAMALSST